MSSLVFRGAGQIHGDGDGLRFQRQRERLVVADPLRRVGAARVLAGDADRELASAPGI